MFFFFNDTATTEIYTLSLHDALPICPGALDCPLEISLNIGIFDAGVIERRPESMPGQELAGTHTHFPHVVYGDLPCRIQILAEGIPVPRVHCFTVGFWSFHDCSPQRILSRDHGSARHKKAPSRVYNGGDMALKKRQHGAKNGGKDNGPARERNAAGKSLDKIKVIRAGTA